MTLLPDANNYTPDTNQLAWLKRRLRLLDNDERVDNDYFYEYCVWYFCNRYKGSQTTATDPISGVSTILFNPRNQVWKEHFQWSMDGTLIIGISATGRATVVALQLNNEVAVEVRRNWVLAGWHPPEE